MPLLGKDITDSNRSQSEAIGIVIIDILFSHSAAAGVCTSMLHFYAQVWGSGKLQALVYNILPPLTAIADYVTGHKKLSVNGQFYEDAQMVVKFVTGDSNYIS